MYRFLNINYFNYTYARCEAVNNELSGPAVEPSASSKPLAAT